MPIVTGNPDLQRIQEAADRAVRKSRDLSPERPLGVGTVATGDTSAVIGKMYLCRAALTVRLPKIDTTMLGKIIGVAVGDSGTVVVVGTSGNLIGASTSLTISTPWVVCWFMAFDLDHWI